MKIKPFHLQIIAIVIGIISGIYNIYSINQFAALISSIFVQTLKWFSLPMIVFSILATTSGLKEKNELYILGGKVLKYTLLTTVIAAAIALFYFNIFNPTLTQLPIKENLSGAAAEGSIFSFLLVIGVLASIIVSIILVRIPLSIRKKTNLVFKSIYKIIMLLVRYFLFFMPLAIWAFVTLFVVDINTLTLKSLSLYLISITASNLTQAIIILPLLLSVKKIPVIRTLKGMLPALNVAFWSKSSGVALPVAINCAKENLKVKSKIADFSMPLCTTINMNACAAFILTTVLFVATSNGMEFTSLQLILWIFIATIAAVGNAGVPMGCFTLSTALVSSLGIPLYLFGLILPFYSLIDMLESAINVWSDSCVTVIVDSEVN